MVSEYIYGTDHYRDNEYLLMLRDKYHREKAEGYYKRYGYWQERTALTNGTPQRVVPVYEIKLRLKFRVGPAYKQWGATIRGEKKVFNHSEISYYLMGEIEDPLDTFDIEQVISYEIKISTSMTHTFTGTMENSLHYSHEEQWRQDQLGKQQSLMRQAASNLPPWFISEKKKSSERRREILLLLKF